MPPSALALLRHIRRLASEATPDPDADAVLLGRFVRHRDEDAFAALVRRHGPMVRRVCRRALADPGAADDAFQAAFCVLARKAASVHPPGALASWLYGVACRVARKARAAEVRRRGRVTTFPDLDPPDPRPDPLADLSARELLAAVDEEVQRLPEVYRLPVILCCLEGRTREEAARQLGWTQGSVKGRLERGRVRLHARLLRRGLTLAAGLAALECTRRTVGAAIPALLAGTTVRSALAFASAPDAAAAVGPSAWALAEAGLRGLLAPRGKVLASLLLAVGLVATGAGLAAQHYLTAPPAEAAPNDGPMPPAGEPGEAGERAAPTDCHGDPLPPGALQRLGTVRFRHGREALSIALSPDGKLLASAGLSSAIRLWDVSTRKEVRQLVGHRGWVWCVAFSPDGKTLASASGDNSVRLWDPATGKELFRFGQHEAGVADGGVLCLAFSLDGKVLGSGGSSGVLHLWDAATGKSLRTLEGHTDWIEAVAFAPDGKTAATGSRDKKVRLWDVATGKALHALTGHEDTVKAVAFAPDGDLLASGGADRTIRLWDVAAGKELRRCAGHQHVVSSLTFSSDGKTLVSGSHDWSVRAWDVASAKEVHQIAVQNGAVTSLALSADGRTLATSSQTIRLWDAATWKEIGPSAGHQGWVGSLAFAPGGKELLSAASDETFRRWDLAAGKELQRYHGHQARGKSVAFAPDGRAAATGAAGGLVQLWELPSGKEVCRLAGH
jgi:RNA polymerase sigma factor (sigma-70 family)